MPSQNTISCLWHRLTSWNKCTLILLPPTYPTIPLPNLVWCKHNSALSCDKCTKHPQMTCICLYSFVFVWFLRTLHALWLLLPTYPTILLPNLVWCKHSSAVSYKQSTKCPQMALICMHLIVFVWFLRIVYVCRSCWQTNCFTSLGQSTCRHQWSNLQSVIVIVFLIVIVFVVVFGVMSLNFAYRLCWPTNCFTSLGHSMSSSVEQSPKWNCNCISNCNCICSCIWCYVSEF